MANVVFVETTDLYQFYQPLVKLWNEYYMHDQLYNYLTKFDVFTVLLDLDFENSILQLVHFLTALTNGI